MNVLPGETACLACVFPDSPKGIVETCDTSGILNSAVNAAASLSATEALKYLVGARDKMRRTLLSFDVWSNDRAEISAARPRPGCRACDEGDFVHLARRFPAAHLDVRSQLCSDPRAAPSHRLFGDEYPPQPPRNRPL